MKRKFRITLLALAVIVTLCAAPSIISFAGAPKTDALTEGRFGDQTLLGWIRDQAKKVEMALSVCGGSITLNKACLLRGMEATAASEPNVPNSKVASPNIRLVAKKGLTNPSAK